MSAGTIAFIKVLIDIIPIAMMGLNSAKKVVEWGLGVVNATVAESRAPTPAEWDQLGVMISDMRNKLHSDTE